MELLILPDSSSLFPLSCQNVIQIAVGGWCCMVWEQSFIKQACICLRVFMFCVYVFSKAYGEFAFDWIRTLGKNK